MKRFPSIFPRRSFGALAFLLALAFVPAAIAVTPAFRPHASALRLVSRADGRGAPAAWASSASIDPSGRFVAFSSGRLGDRPPGIYLRDLHHDRNGFLAPSGRAFLTRDGGLLLYTRAGGSFVRDLATGSVTKVPRAAGGFGQDAAVSTDGRSVVFATWAGGPPRGSGGEAGERLPYAQVYLCRPPRHGCELLSRASGAAGAPGAGESGDPAISATGRYVAFASGADDLVPGARQSTPPGTSRIYLRDRTTDHTALVSRWPGSPSAGATAPSLSADGRYLAFERHLPGHPPDLLVRDLRGARTWRPLAFAPHPIAIGPASEPTLSPDGRFLAFRGAGLGGAGEARLYLADLRARRVRLVHALGADSGPVSFSSAGRYLVFDTFVDADVPKGAEPSTPPRGEVYRYRNPFVGGSRRP